MGSTGTIKRRRWRGRKLWMLAALLGFVLVVRLIWGWWVWRELDRQLAEIRKRGEPVAAADVVYEDVPDAENAWTLQLAAVQAIVKDCPSSSNITYEHYPPYPEAWMKLAKASEQANQRAFSLRAGQDRYRVRSSGAL